jgi:hypothetical protein
MFKKRLPSNKYGTGFTVLLLLVAVLTVTACSVINIGSGDLITETRQVSNFDRVALEGLGEVIVTQGGSESLTIETYDNIMEHVKAEVEDGTLKLSLKEDVNFIFPRRLIFSVGVDDLTGLTIAGSGKIESELIETEDLEVRVGGSGDVRIADLTGGEVKAKISGSGGIDLAGEAAAQDITISGSGKYLAGDMCSESVKVSISGSGDATVCATETLDSNISGSGSVNYYGQPSISTSVSGSGNLNNLGEK